MTSITEIQNLIRSGESETLEFKSSFNNELIETLVAFANTSEGKIITGINPKGEVTGVSLNTESVQNWLNEIKNKTTPFLIPEVDTVRIDNKTIVVFSIFPTGFMVTTFAAQSTTNASEKQAGNDTGYDTGYDTDYDTDRGQKILNLIKNDAKITVNKLAGKLNISKSTVLREIKELKENGKLERIGKEKGRHWKIINK